MSMPRLCKRFAFLSLLLLSAVAPLASTQLARAENAEQEALEVAEGQHGHGRLTFDKIINGDHRWEFIGSIVNFAMLVFVIVRMGKKPVSAFLLSRREGIERGISEAAEVKRAAEQAFNTYTERMNSLDAELNKLRKEVAEAAERDRARIVAEANESVARLKSETESLVKRQAEQLEAQIRREVVAAAAEAAEKAARELATPEDQQRLADTFMRELSKLAEGAEGKRA
jgi:F-type H+-transporting ATPase subunit b